MKPYSTVKGAVSHPEAVVFHPARTTLQQLLDKAKRQTGANHKLCILIGQKPPCCSFLPLDWQFFRTVSVDANLPSWREKLMFGWLMHRLKWAIAWELLYCFKNSRLAPSSWLLFINGKGF